MKIVVYYRGVLEFELQMHMFFLQKALRLKSYNL